MFCKPLHLSNAEVDGPDLVDFPALIALQDPDLRAATAGGHVRQADGADLFFSQPGAAARLPHQLEAYNPQTGLVRAWVRVPRLAARAETVLHLCYGGAAPPPPLEPVYDPATCLALPDPAAQSLPAPALRLEDALTVEAWVYADNFRPETLQPLVSQWTPSASFGACAAYDAGATDGLASIAYFGAVFDGRYVYFAPQHYKDHTAHGIVLRYDTHGDFKDPASYAAYDAGHTDGLNTKGFYGAACDGRYVYFVPRQDSVEYHSRVLRYDTHGDFKAPGSWEAYDVGEAHSQQGVACDGRYLYFSPGFHGDPRREDQFSARVIRFDTQASFKDPSSWRVFDAGAATGQTVGCFDGAAFDGRHIYFAPINDGRALRYDTRGDFADPASWQSFDAVPAGMQTCVGIVFDGVYLYYVPYAHSTVVRFDTRDPFTDPASWSRYEAGGTGGLNTGGFDGGFFDGRFVYFVPFVSPPWEVRADGRRKYTVHSNFLRYDTAGAFDDPGSWSAHAAEHTDGLKTVGYNAGAFDGRFFYLAPWQDATPPEPMHGRLLRYDTLGAGGAFSLRYCDYGHNGGLCAAVRGPAFLVNTVAGPRSVATHHPLTPGWHHLVGVYTGRALKLFVDGALAAQRPAFGALVNCRAPLTLGCFDPGTAHFHGRLALVRLANVARSDDWIRAAYRNLASPAAFVRVGPGALAS